MNAFVAGTITAIRRGVATIQERATRAQRGQAMIEYALILAFIAFVVIVALKFVGPAIASIFSTVTNTLNGQTPIPRATPTP